MLGSPFSNFTTLTSRSQSWIVVQLDHLLDDGVLLAGQLGGVVHRSWVVPTLLNDPIFLTRLHVAHMRAIVVANHALDWVVKAIADVVRSGRDQVRSLDIVHDQSLSFWTDSHQYLSVETTVLLSAVVPAFRIEGQAIVEEVIA